MFYLKDYKFMIFLIKIHLNLYGITNKNKKLSPNFKDNE